MYLKFLCSFKTIILFNRYDLPNQDLVDSIFDILGIRITRIIKQCHPEQNLELIKLFETNEVCYKLVGNVKCEIVCRSAENGWCDAKCKKASDKFCRQWSNGPKNNIMNLQHSILNYKEAEGNNSCREGTLMEACICNSDYCNEKIR